MKSIRPENVKIVNVDTIITTSFIPFAQRLFIRPQNAACWQGAFRVKSCVDISRVMP